MITVRALLFTALTVLVTAARGSTGLTDVPGIDGDGSVKVFYPSSSPPEPLKPGGFPVEFARQGTPLRGNGRLVIISHGSGGSPWDSANLASALVAAGFITAVPTHRGDNYRDFAAPGPESWQRRPKEVSRAIDAIALDPRFAPLLELDKVGIYGMSAGGHTALVFGGGRWSEALFRQHCEAHITEDFAACVGGKTLLRSDLLDPVKKWFALSVISWRFADATWHAHNDPRVKAAVAAVPFAGDFDLDSLATPAIALGLVTAGQDRFLQPQLHSGAVLKICKSCELVADIPNGGHASVLSPFSTTGANDDMAWLLTEPPGFDRGEVIAVYRKIAVFFQKHLVENLQR